ncbi:spermatogenesis-associated protein 13 [Geranomyces variabilis]|nr:spermatogenesis-associated protein 13 [Geranomyces variabilis]
MSLLHQLKSHATDSLSSPPPSLLKSPAPVMLSPSNEQPPSGPFEALLLRHLAGTSAAPAPSSSSATATDSSVRRPSSEQSNYQTCSSPSTPPATQPYQSPAPQSLADKASSSEHFNALELPPAAPPLPVSAPSTSSSSSGESVDINNIPTPSPRPPVLPSPSQQAVSESAEQSCSLQRASSPRDTIKPHSIRTDREAAKPRPVSLAVGFSIGAVYDEDHSGDESSPDSAAEHRKAARLSYNGHQKDHLAALHRFARTTPSSSSPSSSSNSPGSASPPAEPRSPNNSMGSALKTAREAGLKVDTRAAEAPYTGPILSSFAAKNLEDAAAAAAAAASSSLLSRSETAARLTDRRLLQKKMIVNELLETERMYVHDLRTLVESFFDRLNAVSWVPSDKKFSLMRNASELYRFQQEFLTKLEMCVGISRSQPHENEDDESCAVASVFIEMQQRFKVYSQYCTQHDGAIKTLNEYESRPEMVTFLKDFRGLAQTKLDVKDYLIKPVQRLCRYPLLISELIKHSIVDSADLETLVAAHAVMQNVALEIDSAKWRMDNLERTNRFFSRLEPAPSPANDLPRRLDIGDFILAGALFVINSDQYPSKLRYRGVFLFPEYIYVVKPRRMTSYSLKICLALSSCEFRRLNPGESPLPNAWRLVNTDGGQVYDFCSPSDRERTAWTNMLAQLAAPARRLSQHPFLGTVNTLASPSSPISVAHPVTEFFDSLRRTSSAGSMAGMHDDAVAAAGSCGAVAASRPHAATHSAATTTFQRKKFWRQSTAEVRFDMYTVDQPPMPGTPAAGAGGGAGTTAVDSTPSPQPSAYYHPVTGLVRRGSVDMRILDVCTPLLDSNSTGSSAPAIRRSPSHQQLAADLAGPPLPTQKSVPDLNGLHRSILMSSDPAAVAAYPTPDEMPVFDRKYPHHAATVGPLVRKKPSRGYSEAHIAIKRNSRSFAPGMDSQGRSDFHGSLLDSAQQRLQEQTHRRPPVSGRPTHYRASSLSSSSSSSSQIPQEPTSPAPASVMTAAAAAVAPAAESPNYYQNQQQQQRSNSDGKASSNSAKAQVVDLRRTATTTTTQSNAAAIAAAAQSAAYAIPPRSTSFTASAPLLNRYPSRSSISSWISGRSSHVSPPPPAAFSPPPLPAPPPPPPPTPPTQQIPLNHPSLMRSDTMSSAMSAVTAPLPRSLMPEGMRHPAAAPTRASMDPRSRRRESQFYQPLVADGYIHPLRQAYPAVGAEPAKQKRQNVLRRTWSQIFHTGRQIKGALGRGRKGSVSSPAPPMAATTTTQTTTPSPPTTN